jgi:anhydro-N-acetylmuramic acid kinase
MIGVMSGTSLDGLDLAYCVLQKLPTGWTYTIEVAQTIPYSQTWYTRLKELPNQPMFLLPKTDSFFGKYIGQCINQFIKEHTLQVDYIASHGHTIFHNPDENYTTQIGSGAAIYAETGIPTIVDFRSVDVALGGQGAPLVPIGDDLLFSEYDACLNLGGFANISFQKDGYRIAFDVVPCNLILNEYAQQVNKPYDENGEMARSGVLIPDLLNALNSLSYYHKGAASKSLGREWVEMHIYPITNQFNMRIEDILCTLTEHIALQIAPYCKPSTLVTGGGTYNNYLLERLELLKPSNTIIATPESNLINYKEALIFALLGCLRVEQKPNVFPSVTGSKYSSIGGCIYG